MRTAGRKETFHKYLACVCGFVFPLSPLFLFFSYWGPHSASYMYVLLHPGYAQSGWVGEDHDTLCVRLLLCA